MYTCVCTFSVPARKKTLRKRNLEEELFKTQITPVYIFFYEYFRYYLLTYFLNPCITFLVKLKQTIHPDRSVYLPA